MRDLDDYEKEVVRFLADRFNAGEKWVSIDELPRYRELGKDRIDKMVKRFVHALELLQRDTRPTRTMHDPPRWEVLGQVLDVVQQLDDPPREDCPTRFEACFRSKWCLLPFFYLLRWMRIFK